MVPNKIKILDDLFFCIYNFNDFNLKELIDVLNEVYPNYHFDKEYVLNHLKALTDVEFLDGRLMDNQSFRAYLFFKKIEVVQNRINQESRATLLVHLKVYHLVALKYYNLLLKATDKNSDQLMRLIDSDLENFVKCLKTSIQQKTSFIYPLLCLREHFHYHFQVVKEIKIYRELVDKLNSLEVNLDQMEFWKDYLPMLNILSDALITVGDYEEAKKYMNRALGKLSSSEIQNDFDEWFEFNCLFAELHILRSDFDSAVLALRKAEKYLQSEKDQNWLKLWRIYVKAYSEEPHSLNRALEYIEKMLVFARRMKNRQSECGTLITKALLVVLNDERDVQLAFECLEIATKDFEEIYRDGYEEQHIYTLIHLGRFKDAHSIIQKLLSLEGPQKKSMRSPSLYLLLGSIYTQTDDYKNGIRVFKKALKQLKISKDLISLAHVHLFLAEAYSSLDSDVLAVEHSELAINTFEKYSDYSGVMDSLDILGWSLIALERGSEAKIAFKRSRDLAHSFNSVYVKVWSELGLAESAQLLDEGVDIVFGYYYEGIKVKLDNKLIEESDQEVYQSILSYFQQCNAQTYLSKIRDLLSAVYDKQLVGNKVFKSTQKNN